MSSRSIQRNAMRSCERAVARYKVTPMLVASWITRGWSDWMRGRKEQVASLLGQLSRTLDDDWRARNPEIAIHAALLESVATGKTDAEQIDTVLAMMANIDGARRAPYCAELAHAMNARGQQDIALRVLSVGALHARAARQQALVQELTLTRLDALASASRFEDLKVARKEAELRFQKDEIEQGVPGARLSLAALQIALHEGDSKGAEAAFAQIISRAKNIEAPVQMAILDDTAEVLLGGDRAGLAVSALDRVESLGAGLPVELSHSLEAKRQLGVAKYLRAAIAASKGDRLKVRTFAASASELLADDPAQQASAYRARALHLMGAFESSATGREAILEELVRLQKLQEPLGRFLVRGGKDQAGVVATLRARAALLYIDGRADEALEVLDELAIAGISPRLDAGQASCERGIYTAMSGQTETGRELLRACAASGGGWEGAQATTWESGARANVKARDVCAHASRSRAVRGAPVRERLLGVCSPCKDRGSVCRREQRREEGKGNGSLCRCVARSGQGRARIGGAGGQQRAFLRARWGVASAPRAFTWSGSFGEPAAR